MYPFRRLLFRMDAERAHGMGMAAAGLGERFSSGYLRTHFAYEHASLRTKVFGIQFENPVGLAAGFDKNGLRIDFWPLLGFGFAEVGSVSARRSKGNRKPRAFRLEEDRALINRMGLNNQGAQRIAERLSARGGSFPIPLGVNLAKTNDASIQGTDAVQDYVESFELLASHASYIALNISCPNTDDGKTFEEPDALDRLLAAILSARARLGLRVPVLVKLSPAYSGRVVFDSMFEQILAVCTERRIDGFIAANTASDRIGLQIPEDRLARIGPGGLSGAPIRERSTHLVRYLYQRTDGRVPIIGVGGVDSAEAAYEKIRAGASLVQVYTGLVYEGPALVRRIKEGLVDLLAADGFSNITQAIGAEHAVETARR
ncbi:MAG TPA: quinone-dependent dihydroorotate dehydrogenase [Rhodothermales bacterium]